jgi:hypothetical protein
MHPKRAFNKPRYRPSSRPGTRRGWSLLAPELVAMTPVAKADLEKMRAKEAAAKPAEAKK